MIWVIQLWTTVGELLMGQLRLLPVPVFRRVWPFVVIF